MPSIVKESLSLSSQTAKSSSPSKTNSTKTKSSDWGSRSHPHTLILFDVDGTLSASRKQAEDWMIQLLKNLKQHVVIGFVGGSDLDKQLEQLGKDALSLFDFGFPENGATAYRLGELISRESFIGYLGEPRYKQLVNWLLHYLADLDIPIKRGTFIEYRAGMINVSPIGRNCSYDERLAFDRLDRERGIRKKLVQDLKEAFPSFGLQYSIGGQISIDIFPQGWDKTYCLNHLSPDEGFTEIHFFGDKTQEGGNDYELFMHPSVKGHAVTNPQDTAQQLGQIFGSKFKV